MALKAEETGTDGMKKPASERRRGGLTPVTRILFWAALTLVVSGGGTVIYFAATLGERIDMEGPPKRRLYVRLMSTDDQILAEYNHLYGRAVQSKKLPGHVTDALIAAARGKAGLPRSLAKSLFRVPDDSTARRIRETILATWLAWSYDAERIMDMYVNRVYFGSGLYGLDAAARHYFGVAPARLDVQQAAVLAGLSQASGRHDPFRAPDRAARATGRVLDAMVDAGTLEENDAARAKRRPIVLNRADPGGPGVRYFTNWVIEALPDHIGYTNRNLVIRTTLDSGLQTLAERQTARLLDGSGARKGNVGQAAMLTMTPDGAIRAMVGGRTYTKDQPNRATRVARRPGGTFKMFVYLAGLEKGLRPDSWTMDAPVTVDGWRVRNFDPNHQGRILIRDALARSINSVAVQVGLTVGLEETIAKARELGIRSPLDERPDLALGMQEVTMLELTGAYAIIASGGYAVSPYAIREIADANSGEVLYRHPGQLPMRLISPINALAMSNMLSHAVSQGTGQNALINRPGAGKTGTVQDRRDAWYVGYTADLVTSVWLGHDDNAPMREVTGRNLPARLWRDFMVAAHYDLPARSLSSGFMQRAERLGDTDSSSKFTSGLKGEDPR